MDRGNLEWNLNELRKHKSSPYCLANEEIADEMFPFVQVEFPNAIMVKQGISQYIVVSKRAKTSLLKKFQDSKDKHAKAILEIDNVIHELDKFNN